MHMDATNVTRDYELMVAPQLFALHCICPSMQLKGSSNVP